MYAHAVWFSVAMLSLDHEQAATWVPDFFHPFDTQVARYMMCLPVLLVFSVYPLILAINSLALILLNLICGREYETMYSWHRNSILKLFENIIFSICLMVFLTKLFFTEYEGESLYMEDQMTPILVLCSLITIKLCCTRQKNTIYWAVIILLLLTQFINFKFKLNEKYMNLPILLAVLVIDFYYLKISLAKKPAPLDEKEGGAVSTTQLQTTSRSYSDLLTADIQTNLRKKQ